MTEPVSTRYPAYRTAWLALAVVFVLGLFWSNRYEYPLCEYDGCLRIDRWTGRVGWVWNDDAESTDEPMQSARSAQLARSAIAWFPIEPRAGGGVLGAGDFRTPSRARR